MRLPVPDQYQPKYKWRETWPGEGHQDFAGFDGEQSFGRIQLDTLTSSSWACGSGTPLMFHGCESTSRLTADGRQRPGRRAVRWRSITRRCWNRMAGRKAVDDALRRRLIAQRLNGRLSALS